MLHPFVRDGIERGEKAFHIVDPEERGSYARRLQEGGIEVDRYEVEGQLEIRDWNEAYLRDGRFDQEAMLSLIEEILDGARGEGYERTRLVAHMEWSLEDFPGVDDLMEYESRLNRILADCRDPVVCVYDSTKFDGGTVLDILRTHPLVIVGGVLRENPFYVPPDDFLQELRTNGGAPVR